MLRIDIRLALSRGDICLIGFCFDQKKKKKKVLMSKFQAGLSMAKHKQQSKARMICSTPAQRWVTPNPVVQG